LITAAFAQPFSLSFFRRCFKIACCVQDERGLLSRIEIAPIFLRSRSFGDQRTAKARKNRKSVPVTSRPPPAAEDPPPKPRKSTPETGSELQ
jgi:hypothetical protein